MADLNFDKAMIFINKHANDIDKSRYYIYYMDEVSKTHKNALTKLINLRTEGTLFPLDYGMDAPGSVISSIYFLLHFQDAVLLIKEYSLISDLVSTILPYQEDDGSWSESTELLEWPDIPEWTNTNNREVKIWVSSLVTTVLSNLPSSYVPLSVITNGLKYLQSQIDLKVGGLKGYIHSTFIAAPLIYSKMLGNKQFIAKTHQLLELNIEETDFGGTLGWFLESLSGVTTPKIRPLLVRLFQKIKLTQLSDGSFTSEDGDDISQRAKATIQALIGYLKAEERIKTFQKPRLL